MHQKSYRLALIMAKILGYSIPILIYAFLLFTGIPSPVDVRITGSIYLITVYLIFCSLSFFGIFKLFEIILLILEKKDDEKNVNGQKKYKDKKIIINVAMLVITAMISFIVVINISSPNDGLFPDRLYPLGFYIVQLFLILIGSVKFSTIIYQSFIKEKGKTKESGL